MDWKIRFNETALKQLSKLDHQVQRQIRNFLRTRIEGTQNPRLLGDALTGDLSGFWRYRTGDYRIICEIQDQNVTILVVEVGHRREIYR